MNTAQRLGLLALGFAAGLGLAYLGVAYGNALLTPARRQS